MNIGDLVELSAYGRSLKNYYWGRDDDVALIVKVGIYHDCFAIQWCTDGHRDRFVSRKDIRYAKKI